MVCRCPFDPATNAAAMLKPGFSSQILCASIFWRSPFISLHPHLWAIALHLPSTNTVGRSP
ncbi:hypothetical protein [Leptolyngbya sp. O-77]|uniref:hypothetical protein n=1 Tax=Leptolyngbya sp. O-77 TaxID=1080068 RepID=UPI0012E3C1F6|nr:hypothetical protein [Leptolyngbya sp. O-77]